MPRALHSPAQIKVREPLQTLAHRNVCFVRPTKETAKQMRTHRGTSLKAAQYGSKGFEMRNSGKYTHSLLRQRRETTVLIFKATECILHVFKKLCVVRLDLCLAIFHWVLKKKIIQIQFTYGKQISRCNTYGIPGWVEVHW